MMRVWRWFYKSIRRIRMLLFFVAAIVGSGVLVTARFNSGLTVFYDALFWASLTLGAVIVTVYTLAVSNLGPAIEKARRDEADVASEDAKEVERLGGEIEKACKQMSQLAARDALESLKEAIAGYERDRKASLRGQKAAQ